MSEKIVEAVKQAIERHIGEDGFIAQDGYYVKVDALLNLDVIARAAIEAYEAEKVEAEAPWVDALEEAWVQLNLKDGMKIDQARIYAKTRMNIALNTLGKVRESMVNTYNPLSVPDGAVNAWEGRKK